MTTPAVIDDKWMVRRGTDGYAYASCEWVVEAINAYVPGLIQASVQVAVIQAAQLLGDLAARAAVAAVEQRLAGAVDADELVARATRAAIEAVQTVDIAGVVKTTSDDVVDHLIERDRNGRIVRVRSVPVP